MCFFCRHNGESWHVYTSHNLRNKRGKVLCPILRMYTCLMCGASGDSAHTKKYCPMNKYMCCRKTECSSAGHRMRH
ncbi:hypothetical protein GDO78_013251 [Eleutherodactylus coqui]|uniref:Nanos-type domain-containing protein n=1 Tax=Eleutherodactylus coqui TaxID=57060 RepID=A0A8J6F0E5_ELECQ|nr:hypothetical protein GDO78_013251 [Eleutherodactylus coqui]